MKSIRITLRTKPIKNNKESIRLDCSPPIINPATGKKTRWIYTGLSLYAKPRTQLEREHNKETKSLAENIRAQRLLEVQAGQYGFLTEKETTVDFLEFFSELALKKGSRESWPMVLRLATFKNIFRTF